MRLNNKHSHVNAIKNFILSHQDQHFTIREIKLDLDTNYPNLNKISDWSIRKILTINLRYSYKKQSLAKRKSFTNEYVRRFFESSIIQIILLDKGYELLYLDEFSINLRDKSMYGWWPIGVKGLIKTHQADFSMSFMIGFSVQRIYGVYGTTSTHKNASFISFISNALEYRTNVWKLTDTNLVIVWDNSSIHKSIEVKNFIRKFKIKILTISPYCPTLNPAEKMILYIKQKIKFHHYKVRYYFHY